MSLLRPVLPYAFVSISIVVLSIVAMGLTVGGARVAREPTASSAIAPAPLSTSGRLAYWRPSPGDDLELWVSDLDGKRRFPIATAPKKADVELTRWSPDGSAVAWMSDGEVHVMRLDRTRTTVSVPADLQAARWRPVTLEWSPSSKRLAATLRPAGGVSNEGDVFVADLDRTATTWVRRTTTGDAYAGPWLDDERLLTETAAASIGLMSVAGTGAPRPLTAMPAVSPRIGPDGRLYFFGGRGGAAALFSGPLAAGSVWSMTIDGDDLRRETRAERDQGRLQGFLRDGRFIVGVPGALYVAGDEAVLFPWKAGAVRRVVPSQDGRTVIGLTESRVVRADLSKIPRSATGLDMTIDAPTVLLDAVASPDAWFPSPPVTLARSPARPADGPREELTFTFGRSIWRLAPGGGMRELLSAPSQGWMSGPVPSPTGDLVAATVSARTADGRLEASTVILDRDGRRVATLPGTAGTVTWSPDGAQLSLWAWYEKDGYATQLYDTATWTPGRRFAKTRGLWSGAGLVLVDEGRQHPRMPDLSWARVGQAVEVVTPAGPHRVTDADRLARHPLLRGVVQPDLLPAISSVAPSSRATHLLVGLAQFGADGRSVAGALVVVRAADGEPIALLRPDPGLSSSFSWSDPAWAPHSDLIGVTRREAGTPDQLSGMALVLDVRGRALLERQGRFAGWSMDGEWIYLARREGLFAVRLDGGLEARIGPLGVSPVVATPP